MSSTRPNRTMQEETPPVEGEDFYREGAAIVFTALYHLRRGYCCGSGCRHCPYDEATCNASDRELAPHKREEHCL